MARKTDLSDVLFPVALHPIFIEMGEGLLKTKKIAPQSQAVVNTKTGNILGVVSKEYKLITNQEAIEHGKKCCQELLDLGETKSIQVFNVVAPSTGSFCHIDLIHRGFSLNLWDGTSRPETYIPFVRITNSYNTTRALRFDVGFCRKLCLNGTIFESETVQFRYSHIRHEVGKSIHFDIQKGRFEKFKHDFVESMKALKDFRVSIKDGCAVFFPVMRVPLEEDVDIKKKDAHTEYLALIEHIAGKIDGYYSELGNNAYALFNAMTDVASNPPENKFFQRDVNSMQRAAGNWVHEFKGKINAADFSLDTYIKELTTQSKKTTSNN